LGFFGSSVFGSGDGSAGDINNDDFVLLLLAVEFAVDGGKGAEEEIARVSHDGGAARRDFVAGNEFVEFTERAVDDDSGSEFPGVTKELGSDVGGVAVFFLLRGMTEAEAGSGIGDGHAATAATGGTSRAMGRDGFCLCKDDGFLIHGIPFRVEDGAFQFGKKAGTPRQFS
jgi:hypothetical protein